MAKRAGALKSFALRHKKYTLPGGVLVFAIVVYTLLKATAPEPVARPALEKQWTVSVVTVSRADVQPNIVTFGEVAAASVADIKPMVTGRIVKIGPAFFDGAIVTAGDLLVQVDPFDYENALKDAEAQLKDVKAQLKAEREVLDATKERLTLRQRDYQRRIDLQKKGSASDKTVDDALLALADARQQLSQREASISQLEARLIQSEVAVARATRDLNDTNVVAPFDGYVANTAGAVGRRVTPQDTLARMFDSSSLEARFQVSDAEYARLIGAPLPGEDQGDATLSGIGVDGRPAEIRWQVGQSQFTYMAVIERASAEIDTASGGVTLYARLVDHVLDDPLRPGAFVTVVVPDRVFEDAVAAPASAVMNGDVIYTVGADGRLVQHQAMVLRRYDDSVVFRADIENGAQLVTSTFPEIGPGVKVTVR